MTYNELVRRLLEAERGPMTKALRMVREGYGNLTLECDITVKQQNAAHEWVRLFGDALPWERDLTFKAVLINVRKEVLAELISAEEGAYEDSRHIDTGRPVNSHVHKVAQRYPSRLLITSHAEAEDAYYAVCSGTFSLRSLACYRAAVRIATALVEFAEPDTVRLFPISGIEKPEV